MLTTTEWIKHCERQKREPYPREGLDFCLCGAKYWDAHHCASCGERWRPELRSV